MLDRKTRPFEAFLSEVRHGRLAAEAADRLNELVEAVQQTGKAGTLTLSVSVKPNAEGVVTVTGKATAKVPLPEVADSIFFIDVEHNLVRTDPAQQIIPGFSS